MDVWFWTAGLCVALILLSNQTTACTSRAAGKPAPPPIATTTTTTASSQGDGDLDTTTQRPNITFPIFKCPPTYAAWYCLNDATCFTVEIHNEILYNCECANGFMGPRCEYKEIDGSYLPTRQRRMLETASIASGATLALIFVLILCLTLRIRHEKKLKLKLNESGSGSDVPNGNGGGGGGGVNGETTTMAHENEGMDEVDGHTKMPQLRPFGPHHYRTLPLAMAFKR